FHRTEQIRRGAAVPPGGPARAQFQLRREDFFLEDFRADFFADFLADFFAAFLRGTLPPASRASDKPMAMACLRLLTFRPEPPLLSLPSFISCMARPTFSDALRPYFFFAFFFAIGFSSCCIVGDARSRLSTANGCRQQPGACVAVGHLLRRVPYGGTCTTTRPAREPKLRARNTRMHLAGKGSDSNLLLCVYGLLHPHPPAGGGAGRDAGSGDELDAPGARNR